MANREFLADKILELHAALDASEIRHAFGGALALAYCIEEPRATIDIDLNVFIGPDAVETVFAALPPQVAHTEADADRIRRDGQARLHWGETAVDLFFAYHEFHALVASRVRLVPFDGTTIPVLGCSDLAVFKALFARRKDWVDLESAAIAGTIDGEYALGWVAKLLGPDSSNYLRLRDALEAEPVPEPIFKHIINRDDEPG